CAYCTACLGMGRSRECELLVLGMPPMPAGSGEALPPQAERLARWGLSPAQAAAAGAALRYAEAPPDRRAKREAKRNKAAWTGIAAFIAFIAFAASGLTRAIGGSLTHIPSLIRLRRSTTPKCDFGRPHRFRPRDDAARPSSALPLQPASPGAPTFWRSLASMSAPLFSPAPSATHSPSVTTASSSAFPSAPSLSPEAALAPREFLLWAVTGAGKTEMIFPLVESILLRGGRALIATPRRDVVLELDPRLRKAFPDAVVVTLYGGSGQRWESGDITLSTTHQLMRFHQAFQLVIIDELDAFPYHGDPMLYYAARKCCTPGAIKLLLSATPPPELQRAARRGKLPHAKVPVRYHRHPLPVPKLLQTTAVRQMLNKQSLPPRLKQALLHSLRRGAQLFVFVQRIAQTGPMARLLRKELGEAAIEPVSSQDPDRADKVQRFRRRELRVIVTTTILERGVTVPRSDVFILDADGRLFDAASLVQMAGRAGRSADDPGGLVYFCARERNKAQTGAIRQIRSMNRIARASGYLLP
ncbi:helicase-related protein, partial [Paenibacillus thailandensis]